MKEIYTISEFAEIVGVTVQTLRNWDKTGKLKPARLTEGGNRLYSYNQVLQIKNKSHDKSNIIAIYAVTSDNEDQNKLVDMQISVMKRHIELNNKQYKVFKEQKNDSFYTTGIDIERPELKKIIQEVAISNIDEIMIHSENIDMNIKELRMLKFVLKALNCNITIF